MHLFPNKILFLPKIACPVAFRGAVFLCLLALALSVRPAVADVGWRCHGAVFQQAQRRVSLAMGRGIMAPIVGAKRLSVRVQLAWWQALGERGQQLVVREISCAVAGPGQRLRHLRVKSWQNGAVLFDGPVGGR